MLNVKPLSDRVTFTFLNIAFLRKSFSLYLKDGRVKVTLGVCKGKKQFDKRAAIKDRDVQRDIQREFAGKLRG